MSNGLFIIVCEHCESAIFPNDPKFIVVCEPDFETEDGRFALCSLPCVSNWVKASKQGPGRALSAYKPS